MLSEGSATQNGYTALIRAAANGHVDCVRVLLEGGANMEARDHVRCTLMLCLRLCICLFVLSYF